MHKSEAGVPFGNLSFCAFVLLSVYTPPMGQFTLGLRSLLIKATIFVIMAALLAWALGGTLWPRAHVAEQRSSGVNLGESFYYWSITIADRKQYYANWRLVVVPPARLDSESHFADDHFWTDGAGPVAVNDTLYYGGRDMKNQWRMISLQALKPGIDVPMPDRLAVEQQLARLAAGLPLQDAETIQAQRDSVTIPPSQTTLHPSTKPADELKSP